jgi:hypothetical protein
MVMWRKFKGHMSKHRQVRGLATYLHESHNESRINVPLDMAMEQPHSRVIALEPHHYMSVWPDQECVSPHGPTRKYHRPIHHRIGIVIARLLLSAYNGLKGVAVKMEGVLAGVMIVQHDLNDLLFAQNVDV